MMRATATRARPGEIAVYFSGLWLALGMLGGLGGGLAGLPIQFFLKERLHLGPEALALFRFLAATPLYVGFLFGFLRDRWQPLGRGDRGYLLLTAPLLALAYCWLAAGRITYGRLLVAVLVATALGQVLATAVQALTTVVAQQRSMTGRLGAVMLVAQLGPGALAALAGGWMVRRISPHGIFGIAAGAALLLWLLSFWKPRAVFACQEAPPSSREHAGEGEWEAVRRLLRHRPLWPAALILFLWSCAPGMGTPLFYYLTNTLKLSPEAFGLFSGVTLAAFIPTGILYGVLCRRVPLRPLLWWGTAFAVVQVIPLLFCHSEWQIMLFGVAAGMLGGFATAAYLDLLNRSCPKGLEGTGSMLAMSGVYLAAGSTDVVGTWIYQRGGFGLAVLITTAIYALMLPTLLLVPRPLIATREGESIAVELPAVAPPATGVVATAREAAF